jgi:hypothetical protein
MKHWRPMKKLLALAGMLALGGLLSVVLASCGSEGGSSPEASPAQSRSNPYTSPIKTEGSSAAELTGDGRYFGYIPAVDAESRPPTISFDVAQFFFGKDVQKAAEEDGAVSPGEGVPNDHYQRNPETQTQALMLATDASLTAAVPVTRLIPYEEARARCRKGCSDGVIPVSLAEFLASFEEKRHGLTAAGVPVWITIRDGVVIRIDEQYFP